MTPNDIILALIEVASAAFATQHTAGDTTTVNADDLARLRAKLFVLDRLPQPANMPPLTPSAKARYFMQSFLEGAPVEIDGRAFSAAFLLAGLGEQVPQPLVPAVVHTPTNANDGWVLAKETVVEMPTGQKELGYTVIHGFPVFTDEQDAHKSHGDLELPLGWVVMRVGQLIPGYVLPEITRADMDAQRDKLLADTATEAHRIWSDADLLAQLRSMCGYIENGGGELVTIFQDDATREWTVSVGFESRFGRERRRYSAGSFHQALRLAVDGEIESETCKFCGFPVEFPCDEPPVDICSAAIRAEERQRRNQVKPQGMAPAGVKPEEKARDIMTTALLELKDMTSATTAKRIITKIGGVRKMMDIPDVLVPAVTIAARDRINLERRLVMLRHQGNLAAVEALLRGVDEAPMLAPSAAPAFDCPVKAASLSVALQQEANEPITALPPGWPTPPAPIPTDDNQVQGQGGEFDGGGASGDFQ